MIFGGTLAADYINQISIVESCGLKRIGDLPKQFYYGACNTFNNADGQEEVLLCFDQFDEKGCRRYDKKINSLMSIIYGLKFGWRFIWVIFWAITGVAYKS